MSHADKDLLLSPSLTLSLSHSCHLSSNTFHLLFSNHFLEGQPDPAGGEGRVSHHLSMSPPYQAHLCMSVCHCVVVGNRRVHRVRLDRREVIVRETEEEGIRGEG